MDTGRRSSLVRGLRKLVLTVGFLGLAVGLYSAWNTPATGYEVSIYGSTPVVFWGGVGLAFGAGATVCVISVRDTIAGLAVALGGLTAVSIVGLPILRGYQFFGLSDALTHLGWANEIAAGERTVLDLFYPGSHSVSVLLAKTLGIPVPRGMMLCLTILVGVFVLFVPLSALVLTNARGPTVVAAFSGFMLLPFNHISTHLLYHTYSLAVLFLPFVLYLLVLYLSRDVNADRLLRLPSADDIALVVAAATLLLLHGQVKLNFIIIVGSILLFGEVITFRRQDTDSTGLRPLYGQFIAITVLWFVWVLQFPQAPSLFSGMIDAVHGYLLGTEPAGEVVTKRSRSAGQVGTTLWDLFLKIFLVPAVYSVFTVVLLVMAKRDTSPKFGRSERPIILSFGFAFVVLGVFFSLHLPGRLSEYFFRHVGFSILLATVFGAIGLSYTASSIRPRTGPGVVRAGSLILFGLALLLALLIVFPSPYILNNNPHLSEHQSSGYATAFEHHDESVPFSGIRGGPGRFVDGLDPDRRVVTTEGLTERGLREPTAVAASSFYLPVTEADYLQETVAYKELRYSAESFEVLRNRPGLDLVQTNGEFDLYRLQEGAAEGTDQANASFLGGDRGR